MIDSEIFLYDISRRTNSESLLESTRTHALSLVLSSAPFDLSGGEDLSSYIGPCAIVSLDAKSDELISAAEIHGCLNYLDTECARISELFDTTISRPTRLLLRTWQHASQSSSQDAGKSANHDAIQTAPRYLSEAALDVLLQNFVLIGIDAPALDRTSQNNELRKFVLNKTNFSCLLNLDLEGIEPGVLYDLYAAPMLVPALDHQRPVRAILVPR